MEYPMEYLNGVPPKISYGQIKYFINMARYLDVHTFIYFRLSDCYSSMQFTNWPPS